MILFHPATRSQSERHARIFATYEIFHTLVDFAAAILFIIGSVLFFSEATTYVATWMFLIGSVCFALKPSIRLARELHYLRIGRLDVLAARSSE